MKYILVLNCGSSSVKYALYDFQEREITRGIIEEIINHKGALKRILHMLSKKEISLKSIVAVGHRIVHGKEITKSSIITKSVFKKIKQAATLAPLHNPHNIEGIKAAQQYLPKAKNIAVFDTAFHHTLPHHAQLYGIPLPLQKKYHIQRYGFHGISYHYICQELKKRYKIFPSKVIICHLGNGSSVCAIKNGKSIDTSMGFTPTEGLVMGTRSGDIDPGIIFYLQKKGIKNVEHLLEFDSGLKGICGTNNMKVIWKRAQKGNTSCEIALELYCYAIQKYIGAYSAALGGIDALVFTAGIGEHAYWVRQTVCSSLGFLGIRIDSIKNKRNKEGIGIGKVDVLVIPTNEELMIAREVRKVTILRFMDKLLAKSKLTEKDALNIGRKIKKGIARRHGLLK